MEKTVVSKTHQVVFTDKEYQDAVAANQTLQEFLFPETIAPQVARTNHRSMRKAAGRGTRNTHGYVSSRSAKYSITCPVGQESIDSRGSTQHVKKHAKQMGLGTDETNSKIAELKQERAKEH